MKESLYGRNPDQPDIRDDITFAETGRVLVNFIARLLHRAECGHDDAIDTLKLLSFMADAEIDRHVGNLNTLRRVLRSRRAK